MPVQDCHPEHAFWSPYWKKIRDAVGGEPSIKAAGNEKIYLPQPSGQDPEDYQEYFALATFSEFSGRSVSTMVDTMLRKPISGFDTIPALLELIDFYRVTLEKIVDPFSGELDTKGVLNHGHLPENDNHGGKASGIPNPLKLKSGRAPTEPQTASRAPSSTAWTCSTSRASAPWPNAWCG